jgi:hypothetical protein
MERGEIDRDTFPRKGARRWLVTLRRKDCDACGATADLWRELHVTETETRAVRLCRMCDVYSPAMLLLLLEAEAAK